GDDRRRRVVGPGVSPAALGRTTRLLLRQGHLLKNAAEQRRTEPESLAPTKMKWLEELALDPSQQWCGQARGRLGYPTEALAQDRMQRAGAWPFCIRPALYRPQRFDQRRVDRRECAQEASFFAARLIHAEREKSGISHCGRWRPASKARHSARPLPNMF